MKVSYDSSKPKLGADRGVVECSSFEYSAGIGPQYYIGGIDAHNTKDWIVRDNVFQGIRSPETAIAEHAIHFRSGSKNTVVERNVIVNCDRGIGFGLGEEKQYGGIIRNNMLYHDSSRADVGIGLENARGAKVYNNSIFYESDYPNAIEYRFSGTKNVAIVNNLTNKLITQRDGGQAKVLANVTNAEKIWFKDVTSGNLHLNIAPSSVIDQGRTLQKVTRDFDGDKRAKGTYDIGADERR